jgi:mono/diheme cytochrome c family protein
MMRTILRTLAATFALILITAAVIVFSGLYDVSATAPHWRITYWIMDTARVRSIEVYAAGIAVPSGLEDPAKILIGTEHFAAHCAVCHGAPGVPRGDIAHGLYPQPPDLAEAAKHYSPGELFWILKHGIKMTGMPAWSDHSDEELWATVAFLSRLPGMSEQDYAKLVAASITHGSHHH